MAAAEDDWNASTRALVGAATPKPLPPDRAARAGPAPSSTAEVWNPAGPLAAAQRRRGRASRASQASTVRPVSQASAAAASPGGPGTGTITLPGPSPAQEAAGAALPPIDPDIAAQVIDAVKIYGYGQTAVRALAGITASFKRGQFTAIMGPSGSGKSTLMHCLAGLDRLTRGRVLIGSADLGALSDKALTQLRRDRVGFVFQTYNLVPTLSAIENITLPINLAGRTPDKQWLDNVIDTLRIRDRLKHKPPELSGGQQQRVAVARALATRPEIIFADEPTGNLDTRSGAEVLGILRDSVKELGQTVVMVTHDPGAAGYADRAIFLMDGRVVAEMLEPTAARVLDQMKTLGG